MTGSEKQIKWATGIIETIKAMFNVFERENKNDDNIQQIIEISTAVIKNMNNSYAGNIIEDFKDFAFCENKINDSYREFCGKLFVAARFNNRDYRKNAYK